MPIKSFAQIQEYEKRIIVLTTLKEKLLKKGSCSCTGDCCPEELGHKLFPTTTLSNVSSCWTCQDCVKFLENVRDTTFVTEAAQKIGAYLERVTNHDFFFNPCPCVLAKQEPTIPLFAIYFDTITQYIRNYENLIHTYISAQRSLDYEDENLF